RYGRRCTRTVHLRTAGVRARGPGSFKSPSSAKVRDYALRRLSGTFTHLFVLLDDKVCYRPVSSGQGGRTDMAHETLLRRVLSAIPGRARKLAHQQAAAEEAEPGHPADPFALDPEFEADL